MKSSACQLNSTGSATTYSLDRRFLLRLGLICSTLVLFLIIAPNVFHWFAIPVTICGLLITQDMLDWFGGRYDVFDPKGLFGLIGFYFFFLSPLLWVAIEAEMPYIYNPTDWRPWLGAMAIINVFGLVAYHLGQKWGFKRCKPLRESWEICWPVFWVVVPLILLFTLSAWLFFYFSSGGLSGLVIGQSQFFQKQALAGKGWLIMIGRSFPLIILMSVTLLGSRKEKHKSLLSIVLLLFAFFVLQLLFDGLRGSRSSVITSLFIAAGMIHYFWRPFSQKAVLVGLSLVLVFAFFYGFYKTVGTQVLDLLRGEVNIQTLVAKTGRGPEALLLGDLTRTQVQAFLLYRLSESADPYSLQWGATYVGDSVILIPKTLWPDRLPSKVKAGTELMYGKDTYVPSVFQSTRVFGLGGEAMLNFHIFGIPIAYLIWGFLMGRYRAWISNWRDKDLRFVLAPLFSFLLFSAAMSDFDNIIVAFLFQGCILAAAVILIARRRINISG